MLTIDEAKHAIASLARLIEWQAGENERLQGERDKPHPTGRDQLEQILRYYGSQPYFDSSNRDVRVKALLLVTAADELSRMRTTLTAIREIMANRAFIDTSEIRSMVEGALEQPASEQGADPK